jgi:hypothetical protein
MTNKFANALKQGKQSEALPGQLAEHPRPGIGPARRNAKHIGGYFDPAVSKQLRLIALDEETTVQDLFSEALDMLF